MKQLLTLGGLVFLASAAHSQPVANANKTPRLQLELVKTEPVPVIGRIIPMSRTFQPDLRRELP